MDQRIKKHKKKLSNGIFNMAIKKSFNLTKKKKKEFPESENN